MMALVSSNATKTSRRCLLVLNVLDNNSKIGGNQNEQNVKFKFQMQDWPHALRLVGYGSHSGRKVGRAHSDEGHAFKESGVSLQGHESWRGGMSLFKVDRLCVGGLNSVSFQVSALLIMTP
jgi:hypothetical protein